MNTGKPCQLSVFESYTVEEGAPAYSRLLERGDYDFFIVLHVDPDERTCFVALVDHLKKAIECLGTRASLQATESENMVMRWAETLEYGVERTELNADNEEGALAYLLYVVECIFLKKERALEASKASVRKIKHKVVQSLLLFTSFDSS